MNDDDPRLLKLLDRLGPAHLIEEPEGEPVDHDRVRRFTRGELPENERDFIGWMIGRYQNWHTAFMAAMSERENVVQLAMAEQGEPARRLNRRHWAAGFAAIAAGLLFCFLWGSLSPKSIRDGGLLLVYRDGQVSGLEAYTPEQREAVVRAFSGNLQGDVRGEIADALAVRANDLRHDERLVRPVDSAVLSSRPRFLWRNFLDGGRYRVEIYNETGQPVAASAELDATAWTPDEPLQRGGVYAWRVFARIANGEEASAPADNEALPGFVVLSNEKAAEVRARLADAEGSHVVRFAVLAEAGLYSNAAEELQQLEAQNADDETVKQLRVSLEAAAGRPMR
jgi:hypothetical protein